MQHSQALLVRHSRPKCPPRPSLTQRRQLLDRLLPVPFRNLLQASCTTQQPPHSSSRPWRPHLPGDPSAACQPATFWRAATPWSVRTVGKILAVQQVLDRPPSQPATARVRPLLHRRPTLCSRRQPLRPGDNTVPALPHGSVVIDQDQNSVSLPPSTLLQTCCRGELQPSSAVHQCRKSISGTPSCWCLGWLVTPLGGAQPHMLQSGSAVDHVQLDWTLLPHHLGEAPSKASELHSGQSTHCGWLPCRPERPFEETQAAAAAAARRTISEKWAEYEPGPAEGARGRQVTGPGRPRAATTAAQVRGTFNFLQDG